MFLSGPLSAFSTLALKLAGQAVKGFKDNVNHYNKTEQSGAPFSVFKKAAKIRYRLGKDRRYKRMSANGSTGSFKRRPSP